MDLLMRKLLGLTKAIILYIKDRIIGILLAYFYKKILPMLIKYQALLLLELINAWLELLIEVARCIPLFRFSRKKYNNDIDDVDYADIIPIQNIPESDSSC